MKKIKSLLVLAGFAIVNLIYTGSVGAETTKGFVPPTNTGLPAGDLEAIITQIIQWFFYVIGIVALLAFLYTGFLFFTSGGDTEKTTKAKNMALYAILGVVVALVGLVIMNYIISVLGTASEGVVPVPQPF